MTKPGCKLRLDPWAAEYEGSIQVLEGGEPAPVDLRVEQARWEAVRPSAATGPSRLAVVDGVRRVEHRLIVESGERTAFGVLGSYGVGAVRLDGRACVADERVGRLLVAGGGVSLDPLVVPVGRCAPLVFAPASEPDDTPVAPVDGLQKAMRLGEAELAQRLSAEVDVVFQDGPLSFVSPSAPGRIVGFVKRLLRNYLEPAAHALLPRLAIGERTPLFLIEGREPRYSWYLRIAFGRAIESALTGVVRLETTASHGVDAARELADLAAREVPRLASSSIRDPRAPQNLVPIGGLEARLKHLLGDPAVVRRAIEARIHEEVSA